MANATETGHAGRRHGAGRYLVVWAGLVLLTALTYAVRQLDMHEPWHLVAALIIAVTKASLVVLFFMHMWEHGGTTRLTLATALVLVALLIGLVLLDNSTRFPYANPPRPGAWEAPPAAPPLGSPGR